MYCLLYNLPAKLKADKVNPYNRSKLKNNFRASERAIFKSMIYFDCHLSTQTPFRKLPPTYKSSHLNLLNLDRDFV